MNVRRCIGVLLLAAGFASFLGVSDANAFPRRRAVATYGQATPYYAAPDVYPFGYSYSPYVMPLPAYGILPPPLATYNMLYSDGYLQAARDTQPYLPIRDPSEPPARKRSSAFPAVPFGTLEPRATDVRRVRYEITVPYERATVLIDGVKTNQTGLTRTFVTPPLEEDKQYTVTITVQWTDENSETRIRRKDFIVVAGETIRHTFIE